MADVVLTELLDEKPLNWSGGEDLQSMNERRTAYIAALRQADEGDCGLLFEFAGIAQREE